MHALHMRCSVEESDLLSAELWEAGTAGIHELENGGGALTLIARFERNDGRDELLRKFDRFSPAWIQENDTDWVQQTERAWPGQCVGTQLFLAPLWCNEATPPGRERVIHNPGLACGTGDHPCTQLAFEALERVVIPACSMVDMGTGSGILAIAALRLGAAAALGMDTDEAALQVASENSRSMSYPRIWWPARRIACSAAAWIWW